MASENDLRRRMKAIFKKRVTWVEPNVRSTMGTGIPDCVLDLDDPLPVELKMWKITKRGLKCPMRPPQIRYHIMNARKGKRSAILFGVPVEGSVNEFGMYMIPGSRCPRKDYEIALSDCVFVGMAFDWEVVVSARIEAAVRNRSFWK